jgi:methylated-DNA-[protein]-cysteine S-methyltransferase
MSTPSASIHAHCTAQAAVDTPLGVLRLARTSRGLAGAWFDGQKHHPGALSAPERPDDPLLREAAAQLAEYFAGRAARFHVPLDLHGTAFQQAVWQALLAIQPGQTRRYADVARAVGSSTALRAVGAAIGKNPVSIVVPCHRVVGSDGTLTGYAGGLERKRALLSLEGVAA